MCFPVCVFADELTVEGGRQLLQGIRPLSKVQAHKVSPVPQSTGLAQCEGQSVRACNSPTAGKHAGHHNWHGLAQLTRGLFSFLFFCLLGCAMCIARGAELQQRLRCAVFCPADPQGSLIPQEEEL
jgi:hypothetical protein